MEAIIRLAMRAKGGNSGGNPSQFRCWRGARRYTPPMRAIPGGEAGP